MRVALAIALAVSTLALDVQPAPAADLVIKHRVRVHRHYAVGRPWCVIENLGKAVWTCAPTLAQCHAFEIPGSPLYCVRDPIPGRPYAMRW
jgi:hypothetical protein